MSEITVSPQYLTSVLTKALGDPSVELGEWSIQKLKGGLELGSSIYRLSGSARVAGINQSWSLILKEFLPEPGFDDPAGWHYWKRDLLAYQSGLVYDLPGQVTGPRCYDIQENSDGSFWVCMEELKDDQPHPWSIERYAQVARQLGEFNGAYLAGRPIPAQHWLTHDWLKKYLESAAPMASFLRQNPSHPVVKIMLPGLSLPLTLAVWEEAPRMLQLLERMPQTFCHQDAFERNLFYQDGRLIAIDWSFAGIAPLGSELAPLVGVSFGLAHFPTDQAKELDQACFESYLDGLREAGWQPDPRQVRLCYCVTLMLRYTIGATVGQLLPGLLNQATREHWVEGMQQTEENAGKSDPGVVMYYQAIAVEALKLLGLGSMLRVGTRTLSTSLSLGRKRSP